MNSYSNELKVKDALQLYFSNYHFEDGGYSLKWFKIKIGPLYIPMPNTKARIAAVKIHDIHHIVTEYRADWQGEIEIAGWEIASGCGKYYVAWWLNASSFFIGLFLFPKCLFHAFIRGRKAKTNLYNKVVYDEKLLNTSVGELRQTIQTDAEKSELAIDYFLFILCTIASLAGTTLFFYGLWKIVLMLL